jgi:hypothetical protein
VTDRFKQQEEYRMQNPNDNNFNEVEGNNPKKMEKKKKVVK